jgi:hypothetical protein
MPASPRSVGSYYFNIIATNGFLLGFTYFCFSELNQIFLGIISAYLAIRNLTATIPYSRILKRSIEDQASKRTDYQITLDFSDTGMTETAFDIVSICPWSSVTKIKAFKDIIIIYLSSGLHAMIPSKTLESVKMTPVEFVYFVETKIQAQQDAAANP